MKKQIELDISQYDAVRDLDHVNKILSEKIPVFYCKDHFKVIESERDFKSYRVNILM